jgi:hypothetical protein
VVPGERRCRRHAEDTPADARAQAAERGQQRSVSGLVGRPSDLASEHGGVVTQCEELDPLGIVAASREDGELEQAADGKLDEGPQPAALPVPSHAADGSRSGLDPEVPV